MKNMLILILLGLLTMGSSSSPKDGEVRYASPGPGHWYRELQAYYDDEWQCIENKLSANTRLREHIQESCEHNFTYKETDWANWGDYKGECYKFQCSKCWKYLIKEPTQLTPDEETALRVLGVID